MKQVSRLSSVSLPQQPLSDSGQYPEFRERVPGKGSSHAACPRTALLAPEKGAGAGPCHDKLNAVDDCKDHIAWEQQVLSKTCAVPLFKSERNSTNWWSLQPGATASLSFYLRQWHYLSSPPAFCSARRSSASAAFLPQDLADVVIHLTLEDLQGLSE